MSAYLAFSGATNYVDLYQLTSPPDKIKMEWSGFVNSGLGNVQGMGKKDGTSFYIGVNNGNYIMGLGGTVLQTSGGVVIGERFTISLEVNLLLNTYEVIIDTVSTWTGSSSVSAADLMASMLSLGYVNSGGNNILKGGAFFANIYINEVLANKYDPSISAPITNQYLYDTVGGNHGKLENFSATPYVDYISAENLDEVYASDNALRINGTSGQKLNFPSVWSVGSSNFIDTDFEIEFKIKFEGGSTNTVRHFMNTSRGLFRQNDGLLLLRGIGASGELRFNFLGIETGKYYTFRVWKEAGSFNHYATVDGGGLDTQTSPIPLEIYGLGYSPEGSSDIGVAYIKLIDNITPSNSRHYDGNQPLTATEVPDLLGGTAGTLVNTPLFEPLLPVFEYTVNLQGDYTNLFTAFSANANVTTDRNIVFSVSKEDYTTGNIFVHNPNNVILRYNIKSTETDYFNGILTASHHIKAGLLIWDGNIGIVLEGMVVKGSSRSRPANSYIEFFNCFLDGELTQGALVGSNEGNLNPTKVLRCVVANYRTGADNKPVNLIDSIVYNCGGSFGDWGSVGNHVDTKATNVVIYRDGNAERPQIVIRAIDSNANPVNYRNVIVADNSLTTEGITSGQENIDFTGAFTDLSAGDYRLTQVFANANLVGKGIDGSDIVSWAYADSGGTVSGITAFLASSTVASSVVMGRIRLLAAASASTSTSTLITGTVKMSAEFASATSTVSLVTTALSVNGQIVSVTDTDSNLAAQIGLLTGFLSSNPSTSSATSTMRLLTTLLSETSSSSDVAAQVGYLAEILSENAAISVANGMVKLFADVNSTTVSQTDVFTSSEIMANILSATNTASAVTATLQLFSEILGQTVSLSTVTGKIKLPTTLFSDTQAETVVSALVRHFGEFASTNSSTSSMFTSNLTLAQITSMVNSVSNMTGVVRFLANYSSDNPSESIAVGTVGLFADALSGNGTVSELEALVGLFGDLVSQTDNSSAVTSTFSMSANFVSETLSGTYIGSLITGEQNSAHVISMSVSIGEHLFTGNLGRRLYTTDITDGDAS